MKINIFLILISFLFVNSALAQNFSDDLQVIKLNSGQMDKTFARAVSLYGSGQYGAALIELGKIVNSGNMSIQSEAKVDFMKSMCEAKLMRENTNEIISEYIENSKYPAYISIALLELAHEYIAIDDVENGYKMLNRIDVRMLERQYKELYAFLSAYIDLKSENYDKAYDGFKASLDMDEEYSNKSKYFLGYIDYRRNDLTSAYNRFKEVAEVEGYQNVNLYLIQIKFLERNFQYVLDNGEKVLSLSLSDEADREIRRLIGEANFNLANYAQAINWITDYKNRGGEMSRELLYQMGYSNYMQNMYKPSVDYFVQIITGTDALAQNAYYHLADAYLKTGNKKGAMRAFSMAASFNHNDKITEDALYNYARMTYEATESGLYTQKITLLKKYINDYPSNRRTEEIRGYLLTIYLNSSNYDAAIAELRRMKNPNNEIKGAVQRLYYNKGTEYFEAGDYQAAISEFNKSLSYQISPKYTSLARFWKAESMFKGGNYGDDVVNLYSLYMRQAQPSLREYKMAQYNLGYIYFNREDWKNAITAFEKFIANYKLNDKFMADAYLRIADAYFVQKNYSAARKNYLTADSKTDINDDYAQLQVAVSEGLMGRNGDKVKTLSSIIDRGNSSYLDQVTVELGATYNKMGKFDSAISVLSEMLQKRGASPYVPSAMMELGVALVNSGKEKRALENYKTVINNYSSSTEAQDALLAVKSIYVSQGDVDSYFSYLKKIGKEGGVDNSEREKLRYDAIQRQYMLGNHDGVIKGTKAYRAEFPSGVHSHDVTYYFTESLIANNDDRADQEIEKMRSAEVNQYSVTLLNSGVKFYKQRGQHDKVLSCFNDIYRLSTNPSERRDVLENMMDLSLKKGTKEQMMASAELVLKDKNATDKSVSLANFVKGRAYYEKGNWRDAVMFLEKSNVPLSVAEGVQSKYLLADALMRDGKLDESERVITKLSNSDTQHQYWVARAFILYGDIYAKRGDLFQAKATYQSIIEGYGKLKDGIIDTAKKRIDNLPKEESVVNNEKPINK